MSRRPASRRGSTDLSRCHDRGFYNVKGAPVLAHLTITARNERKESSMNTYTTLSKRSLIQLYERRAARAGILLLLLLVALPCAVQAQFTYTVSDGKVTITGYTGPGGALTIPSAIASL